jgi:hypothetical protein
MNIITSIAVSWVGRIGLLLVLLGIALIAFGSSGGLPARSALSTVEGTVSEATQITRTRTRKGEGRAITGIDFLIAITGASGGEPVKLTIPSGEITRDQVTSIINRRVKAEYDGERDVYVLSSGGRDFLTYEASIQKRVSTATDWSGRGKIAIGLGAPLVLLGWPLGARKRRKAQGRQPARKGP